MKIQIGDFEFTECWDGVLYKKLSNYPNISDWEIQNILDFICYEEKYGRISDIEATDEIIQAINAYKLKYESGIRLSPPDKITECTACPKFQGCMTDLVCHTSPLENAIKILDCGSLLSPVIAGKTSAEELQREPRNAAKDPADYFNYIMFAWGNCQAGDRLVMERKLGRFPEETDLSTDFTPGVRFFFRYNDLKQHANATFDGVIPMKIKDELKLAESNVLIIAPENYRDIIKPHITSDLIEKVHYVKYDCKDIWEWSEKVYEYAKSILLK